MISDSNKLSGEVAVVTGASKGIGAAIARVFAAEGAAVVVNYSASKTGADKVVRLIKSKRGKAVALQADMTKQADIKRLFHETKKAFGSLDILVNNAGVYDFVPLENITEEHFHRQFNLNVLGLILACQEAVKQFGSAGGNIINISSGASKPKRRRRSVASDNQRTSQAWQSSSPQTTPPGSPAKHSSSPEAFAETDKLKQQISCGRCISVPTLEVVTEFLQRILFSFSFISLILRVLRSSARPSFSVRSDHHGQNH